MLNQIVIVGRLTETPEINEGKTVITLAVPRSFKNTEGEYDTDFIPFVLMGAVAENTAEWCKKGDIVGIKGRVSCLPGEGLKLIADKVTFLASKKED